MSNIGDSNELDSSLISFERLDRASPEMWPELPGGSDYGEVTSNPPKWLEDVERVDHDMLREFGSLTPSQLIEKVKGLQQLAFQLGLEEAHEMVRGKFLSILSKPQKKI